MFCLKESALYFFSAIAENSPWMIMYQVLISDMCAPQAKSNIKNSTKRQPCCRLCEFLGFNSIYLKISVPSKWRNRVVSENSSPLRGTWFLQYSKKVSPLPKVFYLTEETSKAGYDELFSMEKFKRIDFAIKMELIHFCDNFVWWQSTKKRKLVLQH